MRIIAGKHKGRRIELGKDNQADIRPTSDFAREAIFNILAHGKHGLGASFEGQRVLDVFCGTGAFGLESLSRGAAEVTFIDQSRHAIAVTRQNAEMLQELDHVEFIQADATTLGRARKAYSLIFLDPPYFGKLIPPTLKCLQAGGWIDADALIVAEHDAKETLEVPTGFTVLDERRYGRAMVKLVKLTS